MCLGLMGYVVVIHSKNAKRFIGRNVGTATPGTLGAIRMVVCGILLANVLWEDLASTADLPVEMRVPLGVIKILHLLPINFNGFLDSQILLTAWQWMTGAALFLAMIGLRTRIALPVATIGYLILGGIMREYSHNFHTCLIPLYCLIVLLGTPSQDGWSFDRLLAISRGQPTADANAPMLC